MNSSPEVRKHRAFSPGRVQLQVLAGLAHDDCTVSNLARNWPGLSESSVRSAVLSLCGRCLVDAIRFDGNARVWTLTTKGEEWVAARWDDEIPDDLDA